MTSKTPVTPVALPPSESKDNEDDEDAAPANRRNEGSSIIATRPSKKRRLGQNQGEEKGGGTATAAALYAGTEAVQELQEEYRKPAARSPLDSNLKEASPKIAIKDAADNKDNESSTASTTLPAQAAGDTESDKLDDRLTFPERLMFLLQNGAEVDALWWQKDGLSFAFEPKLFTEKVLNKLFPTKIKFESFIRKLNRWGFRRVPGQGLPPNGAAYKHPFFKKQDPELIKSMKFGQKADSSTPASSSNQSLKIDSFSTGSSSATFNNPHQHQHHLVATEHQTSAGFQALDNAQRSRLLQTMSTSQQQPHAPGDTTDHFLGNHSQQQNQQQNFASTSGLNFNLDLETQELRNRLLLAGLSSTIPPLQLATAAPHLFLGGSCISNSQAGRRLSSHSSEAAMAAAGASPSQDILRSAPAMPPSLELQMRLSAAMNQTDLLRTSATLDAYRGALGGGTSVGTGASNVPPLSLDAARMLLLSSGNLNIPSSSAASSSVGQQFPYQNTSRASAQILDQQRLAFLRLHHHHHQQQATVLDPSSELLLLLEHERLRRQHDANNNRNNNNG